ncbi:helix-turn-helix transcriptional regulator [Anaeromyxobacter dehalogenans]|uniref:Transcriptional regulator, LuxR family n=1 Tax=Anaeromyxobacter dehalogenans (strain 2CP-C) TaxID=290397 RepID=Q2IMR1_ANADE|nr:helix-turn-helix transcriptional regulator [Anaeromyxobacter dehalogenans]ABC80092.1 transcriptional regulator, LuxR family [Anaeromyxobacter dehalogenans 2CP-C]
MIRSPEAHPRRALPAQGATSARRSLLRLISADAPDAAASAGRAPAGPAPAAVARAIAGAERRPLAWVDRDGVLRLANAAFAALLGAEPPSLEGRSACDLLCADAPGRAQALLRAAFRGALHRTELTAVRGGRTYGLKVELAAVGRGASAALCIDVHEVVERAAAPVACATAGDLDYRISAGASDFGRLLALSGAGAEAALRVGRRCHEVLHGRPSPCPGCPALRGGGEAWPRVEVRRAPRTGGFQVATATALPGDEVLISVRRVDDAALAAVREARTAELVRRFELSPREEEVLRLLLIGRQAADIGTALGITPRTAKFHQANVLRKLGASSRRDLLGLAS